MKALRHHLEEPRDLHEARLWRDALQREIQESAEEYRRIRNRFQEGAYQLKAERNRRYEAHQELVARYKYIKQRCHDLQQLHIAITSQGRLLTGEEKLAHNNALQEAAKQQRRAEADERNRQKRVIAHHEDTTNPYLLLGAVKELLDQTLDRLRDPATNKVPDDVLSIDDRVMLRNVMLVLRSPLARESINQYIATKTSEIALSATALAAD